MGKKGRVEGPMQLIYKARITQTMFNLFLEELAARATSTAAKCTKLNKNKFQACFKPLETSKVLKLLPEKQVLSKGISNPTIIQ